MLKQKYILIYGIIILAIVSRFLPHMANVSIITALGIFGAVYLPTKQAIAIPLLARLGSDLILGFFSWPLMIAVYASHLFAVVIGLWVKRSKEDSAGRWIRIGSAGFLSAIIFFLATNFVMLYPNYYPQTFEGLIMSYTNGLPFLRGTVIGDIGYTFILFGSWALVRKFASAKVSANTQVTG